MNRFPFIALATALYAGDVAAQTLQDDFSKYAAGSDAAPAWEAESVGWETRDKAYFGDNGASLWHAAPFGSVVTFACDVTVLEQIKGDWLVAGIGLRADEKNLVPNRKLPHIQRNYSL